MTMNQPIRTEVLRLVLGPVIDLTTVEDLPRGHGIAGREVVVDCDGLDFADVAFVNWVAGLRRSARSVSLVQVPPTVRRLLDVVGLADVVASDRTV